MSNTPAERTLRLAITHFREHLAELLVRRDAYALHADQWRTTVATYEGRIETAQQALLWMIDGAGFDAIDAQAEADYPAALARMITQHEVTVAADGDHADAAAEVLAMLRELAAKRQAETS